MVHNASYKEPDLTEIKPMTITYTIKMKDSFIQYSNDVSTLTFQMENEFVKETDELNTIGFPYLKWKYSKADNHKLPNIPVLNYDFYYRKVTFDIYKITNDKLFIVETIGEFKKKYFLEKCQSLK
jgi:hypothetical protein